MRAVAAGSRSTSEPPKAEGEGQHAGCKAGG